MKKDPVANSTKISVTFEAPAEIQAESLAVVGEFNAWDATAAPMKRRKDGVWAKTLRLDPGSYCYRFLADGQVWHNDPAADGYQPSGHGEDNCVVSVGG
jgi:1,4-alpha-glucan branching enzyme